MNWYKAKAKSALKKHFSAIQEGETVNYRINEERELQSVTTLRYIFNQISIPHNEVETVVEILKTEDLQLLQCSPELTKSLEDNFQRLLKEAQKLINKELSRKKEQEKVEKENLDAEIFAKVKEIADNKEIKTKKDKIVEIVKQTSLRKKSDIQIYFPTDKTYLDEVFEKEIYGKLISFDEKRELEKHIPDFAVVKLEQQLQELKENHIIYESEKQDIIEKFLDEKQSDLIEQEKFNYQPIDINVTVNYESLEKEAETLKEEAIKTQKPIIIAVQLNIKKGDTIKTKDGVIGKIIKYPSNKAIEIMPNEEQGMNGSFTITKEDIVENIL